MPSCVQKIQVWTVSKFFNLTQQCVYPCPLINGNYVYWWRMGSNSCLLSLFAVPTVIGIGNVNTLRVWSCGFPSQYFQSPSAFRLVQSKYYPTNSVWIPSSLSRIPTLLTKLYFVIFGLFQKTNFSAFSSRIFLVCLFVRAPSVD